jgi:putative PEP-CTERM system TPR-repeat lipoprotein
LLKDFPAEGAAPALAGEVLAARGLAEQTLGHTDAAQAEVTRALAADPHGVAPLLASAQLAISRNDAAGARKALDAALAIDPHSADALLRKGELLSATRDNAAAITTLDAAVAAAPADYSIRLARAGIYVSSGQDALAKTDVDATLKQLPGSAMAIYLQAVLLTRAQDYKAADADLQRLSPVIGGFPSAYFFQAVVKDHLGEDAEAVDAARKYAARNPADPRGAELLATIELKAKRPASAIEALQKFLAAGGTATAGVYELLGNAYGLTGQPGLAAQSYQQAVKLAPDNPALLSRLGASRLAAGDPNAAVGDLQRSIQLDPKASGNGRMLVVAALAAGDLDAAAQELTVLRQQQGTSAEVLGLSGTLQLARLDLAGARADFLAVLHQQPNDTAAMLNLARIDSLEGHPEAALQRLSEVLAHDPTNAIALGSYTSAMLASGKPADAIAAMERAHAAAPANLRLTTVLADLYLRSNAAAKALALATPAGAPGAAAPSSADRVTLLAIKAAAQRALGQNDAAIATYREILNDAPAAVGARMQLAQMLLAAKDTDGAKRTIDNGIADDPSNYTLLEADVGLALRSGGLPVALARATELAKDPAHQPAAYALTGDLELSQHHNDAAVAAYTAALQQAPSALLAMRLATALNAAGNQAGAAQALRDWLRREPDNVTVLSALASLEIGLHQDDAAETHLRSVLAKQPNDATALNNLAWLAQKKGAATAQPLAQRAYLLAPGAQTADTYGWILTEQGAAARGLPLLRQATQQMPGDPTMAYHLAVALADTGDRAAALKLLTPVVAKAQDFADKQAAMKLFTTLSAGQ